MKNLIQWKPLSELDDFFSDSHRPMFPALQADLAVDVYEENDNIIAKMSLPGVEKRKLAFQSMMTYCTFQALVRKKI